MNPDLVERVAIKAMLAAARRCMDSVVMQNESMMAQGTHTLRSYVAAVTRDKPSHSRVRRTAESILQLWVPISSRYIPGMAVEIMRCIESDESSSKEFKAFCRAIDRAEELLK